MRGREPSATRFRRGTENRGFNQIKKFLRQITPKNKLHYFSEKKFLVLGVNQICLVCLKSSYKILPDSQKSQHQHDPKQW